MTDNHYENSRLAAVYDLDSGWSVDREFYLALASSPQMTILDVGCGTGLLCNEYAARNHEVTGVDPSCAMLDVAREKQHGKKIEWVQAFAQEFELNKSFDLIIMTGHAFQVLHNDDDVFATLRNMRKHLKHDGLIVFESRNPAINWENNWNYDLKIHLLVDKRNNFWILDWDDLAISDPALDLVMLLGPSVESIEPFEILKAKASTTQTMRTWKHD